MSDRQRIVDIILDEKTVVRRKPEVEHERAVAIFDLIESNSFTPAGHDEGPYRLRLGISENRLIFDISNEAGVAVDRVAMPLAPYRRIVKDYFLVCESYYAAIRTASPSKIEAIDMGRRGLHNEGSQVLLDQLAGKVEMDFDTARRLFTLICVLHIRG
jgi:uncharacterized protein (UPF0262 family)